MRTFKNYYPFGMAQPGDEIEPMLVPATLPTKWGIHKMTGWVGALQLNPAELKVNLDYSPTTADWTLGKDLDTKALGTYELNFDIALDAASDNELKVTIKDVTSDQIIKEEVYKTNGNFKLRYLATSDQTRILFQLKDPTPNIGSSLEVTNIAFSKTDFGDYRYGFNGKENDQEWGKLIQDYGFRLYNPAIAKFLSVDPLSPSYPELTPYQFASNTPIDAIDLDGLEAWKVVSDNFHHGTLFRATDKNWIKQQGEAVKAVFLLRRPESDMQISGYDNAYGSWTTVSDDPFANDMNKKGERFVSRMQQGQSTFLHKAAPFFAAALAPIAIAEVTGMVSMEGLASFSRLFKMPQFRLPFTGSVSTGLLNSTNLFGAGESAMLVGGINLGAQIFGQIGNVAYRDGTTMDYMIALEQIDVADAVFAGATAYSGNFLWSILGSSFLDVNANSISTPIYSVGKQPINLTNRPVSGMNFYEPAEQKGFIHIGSDIFWNSIGAAVGLGGKAMGANPFVVSSAAQGVLAPLKINAKKVTGSGSRFKDYGIGF